MPYQLVPNSGQSLLDTRDVIRENFNIIKTAQSVNHVVFDNADQGKHKYMQMPEVNTQTPPTAPSTAVNEGALYTKVGPISGVTELFFRREGNGAELQLTGGFIPTVLTGSKALTTSMANIVLVPANSWGSIFLSSQSSRKKIQNGFFFSDGSIAYAFSNTLDPDTGSAFSYVLFENNPANLNIRGRTDNASDNATYDYKVVYWTL